MHKYDVLPSIWRQTDLIAISDATRVTLLRDAPLDYTKRVDTLFGIDFVIDNTMPDGKAELRDDRGGVLACIDGL